MQSSHHGCSKKAGQEITCLAMEPLGAAFGSMTGEALDTRATPCPAVVGEAGSGFGCHHVPRMCPHAIWLGRLADPIQDESGRSQETRLRFGSGSARGPAAWQVIAPFSPLFLRPFALVLRNSGRLSTAEVCLCSISRGSSSTVRLLVARVPAMSPVMQWVCAVAFYLANKPSCGADSRRKANRLSTLQTTT